MLHRRLMFSIPAIALLAIFIAPLACAANATVTSIDREPVSGTVTGVDAQKRLLLQTRADEPATGVPLDGIEEIAFDGRSVAPPENDACPFRIVLTDGTTLVGILEATPKTDHFSIRTLSAFTLTVHINSIARIEYRPKAKPDADRIPTKDELGGRVEEFRASYANGDQSACDVIELNDKGIALFLPGITKSMDNVPPTKWDNLRSVVRTKQDFKGPTELFGIFLTTSGDSLRGVVTAWNAEGVKLQTQLCGEVTVKAATLVSAVFKNGKFVFLSDMDPKTVEEYPYFRAADFKPDGYLFAWRRDSAQGGGALTLRGRQYSKGLGVHAISKLTFRADKKYTKFSAICGVDDSAAKLGSVVFKVLVNGKPAELSITKQVDGKPVTTKAADTGTLRPTDSAVRVEVDTTGADDITLIVEAADNADIGDRADWANAKLVR